MAPEPHASPPQGKPIDDAIAEFVNYAEKDGGGGNYARDAERVLHKWYQTQLADRDITTLDDLHARHLAVYARYLKRRAHADAISGRTAHVYFARVRAFLTYCQKWGYIADNPAATQKVRDELPDKSAGTDGTPQQFWSATERAQLTRYADQRAHKAIDDRGVDAVTEARDRALVYMLAYSGARVGELVRDPNDDRRDGIQWRDLNLDNNTVTVLGKNQNTEEVQLPQQTQPAIDRYRQLLDPPSEAWPVFPTNHPPTLYTTARTELPKKGVEDIDTRLQEADVSEVLRQHECPPPSITTDAVRKLLRRLCEEGDIDVEGPHEYLKPHGARRGVGEVLYRTKGHQAAQRALRHADPTTTSEMYSHIEASALAEEASDAFETVDQ